MMHKISWLLKKQRDLEKLFEADADFEVFRKIEEIKKALTVYKLNGYLPDKYVDELLSFNYPN